MQVQVVLTLKWEWEKFVLIGIILLKPRSNVTKPCADLKEFFAKQETIYSSETLMAITTNQNYFRPIESLLRTFLRVIFGFTN